MNDTSDKKKVNNTTPANPTQDNPNMSNNDYLSSSESEDEYETHIRNMQWEWQQKMEKAYGHLLTKS